ncbi:hypothetical protein BV20DRAFT_271917 [Pilatotrama ljubarskyi]|nr:hypothetical protein BV20DRAFT_271917 [Pilatotrama ljubarskyi]
MMCYCSCAGKPPPSPSRQSPLPALETVSHRPRFVPFSPGACARLQTGQLESLHLTSENLRFHPRQFVLSCPGPTGHQGSPNPAVGSVECLWAASSSNERTLRARRSAHRECHLEADPPIESMSIISGQESSDLNPRTVALRDARYCASLPA